MLCPCSVWSQVQPRTHDFGSRLFRLHLLSGKTRIAFGYEGVCWFIQRAVWFAYSRSFRANYRAEGGSCPHGPIQDTSLRVSRSLVACLIPQIVSLPTQASIVNKHIFLPSLSSGPLIFTHYRLWAQVPFTPWLDGTKGVSCSSIHSFNIRIVGAWVVAVVGDGVRRCGALAMARRDRPRQLPIRQHASASIYNQLIFIFFWHSSHLWSHFTGIQVHVCSSNTRPDPLKVGAWVVTGGRRM